MIQVGIPPALQQAAYMQECAHIVRLEHDLLRDRMFALCGVYYTPSHAMHFAASLRDAEQAGVGLGQFPKPARAVLPREWYMSTYGGWIGGELLDLVLAPKNGMAQAIVDRVIDAAPLNARGKVEYPVNHFIYELEYEPSIAEKWAFPLRDRYGVRPATAVETGRVQRLLGRDGVVMLRGEIDLDAT